MSAHHVRNRSSQAFKSACAIVSRYRWCLTGTPIHNSLDDYGALLSFVGVSPFAEKSMFDFWITSPIKSKSPDGFRRLQSLVKATCLRRTKAMIGYSLELPRRIEDVEYIDLHPADQELYNFFKTKTANIAAHVTPYNMGAFQPDGFKENNILVLINFLRLICNHGKQLLPPSAVEAWKARDGEFIDWKMMRDSRKRCDMCDTDVEEVDVLTSGGLHFHCRHFICTACTNQQERNTTEEEMKCPKCVIAPGKGKESRITPAPTLIPPSAKVEALLRNLRLEQTSKTRQSLEIPIKRFAIQPFLKVAHSRCSLPSVSFSLIGLKCLI
jgi:SNF2 family DNA or RNA helicase